MILKIKISKMTVGYLADENNQITFQYDPKWIKSGFSISPLKLPLSKKVFSFQELARVESFLGLPGIFADSLPDKFGNSIINAYMSGKGLQSPKQLQKLAYIGSKGMGALEYEPQEKTADLKLPLQLRKLVDSARKVISGKLNKQAAQIMSIGSSAGGARAKAVIAWNKKTNEIRAGNLDAPLGFEHWIIKFDVAEANAQKDWTKVEYAYFMMAKDCGIQVPEFSFIKDDQGLTHFLIKRFDRNGNDKILIHTYAGLIHNDFNSQRILDYKDLMDTVRNLKCKESDVVEVFRRCVFNVLAKNQDDHTKNFSFLFSGVHWQLSPAYDLNYAVGGWCEEHQMTIAGKSSDIRRADLIKVARSCGVASPHKIIDQVIDILKRRDQYFKKCKIPKSFLMRNRINQNIAEALDRM